MGDAITTPTGIDAKAGTTAAKADTPAKTSAAEATAQETAPDAVDDLVDQWLKDQINDSALSRDTEAYNHLRESLPALKTAIRGL